MSPVQSITIGDHTKPLYLCETCLKPASFGFTVLENNHRRRKWFCRDHRASGEALLSTFNTADEDQFNMGGEKVA